MNKTEAQKKAIKERYDEEGELKDHSGGHKKNNGSYREEKNESEKEGEYDTEGGPKHKKAKAIKCPHCGK